MNFDDLSPELQAKAKACTSPEELKALAEAEGFELSDEMLDAVSGGGNCDDNVCGGQECYNNVCHDLAGCFDHYCWIDNCPTESCFKVTCKTLGKY